MRIKSIIDQLIAQCPSLTDVKPAASLVAVEVDDPALPIAYVYSVSERSPVDPDSSTIQQRQEQRFAVLIAANSLDIDTGVDQMEDARDEIRAALIGFEPDNTMDPVESAEGEVVSIEGDLMWWRDEFRTWKYIRQ